MSGELASSLGLLRRAPTTRRYPVRPSVERAVSLVTDSPPTRRAAPRETPHDGHRDDRGAAGASVARRSFPRGGGAAGRGESVRSELSSRRAQDARGTAGLRRGVRSPSDETSSPRPAGPIAVRRGYVPVFETSPTASWKSQPSLRQRRTVPARLVVFSTTNGARQSGHGIATGRSQLANLQSG